jgi:hypothetical protein
MIATILMLNCTTSMTVSVIICCSFDDTHSLKKQIPQSLRLQIGESADHLAVNVLITAVSGITYHPLSFLSLLFQMPR